MTLHKEIPPARLRPDASACDRMRMTVFLAQVNGVEFELDVERGDPGRPACDMYPAEQADDPYYKFCGASIEDVDGFMGWLTELHTADLEWAWPQFNHPEPRVYLHNGINLTKGYGMSLFDAFCDEIRDAVGDWLNAHGDLE
ncbi:MAG: hypothetical protein OSB57_12950 [Planctomycetota bacterium]|nr:hypothetical protein [Planctomycetota bacterium]